MLPFSLSSILLIISLASKVSSYLLHRYSTTISGRALPSGWSCLGCVAEPSGGARVLSTKVTASSPSMTQETCLTSCINAGYSFAGLEFGAEGWCGNNPIANLNVLSDPSCNTTCGGNSSEKCGGTYILSLFGKASQVSSTWTYVGCFSDSAQRTFPSSSSTSAAMTPRRARHLARPLASPLPASRPAWSVGAATASLAALASPKVNACPLAPDLPRSVGVPGQLQSITVLSHQLGRIWAAMRTMESPDTVICAGGACKAVMGFTGIFRLLWVAVFSPRKGCSYHYIKALRPLNAADARHELSLDDAIDILEKQLDEERSKPTRQKNAAKEQELDTQLRLRIAARDKLQGSGA
ncbi:hypothetical protein M407DRAFT_10850 [Tulasnella calospora MUT 4182]|uniref:WSC domain-containing protein n=1 Tax=Tulasnella calospora MUT 4182 TaxID=1051891 RepID=A0A0C3KG96_9AGAM|nr:hypothetical protein M407DRAFT_10850 [Tulasnella calospora MUT 4182]